MNINQRLIRSALKINKLHTRLQSTKYQLQSTNNSELRINFGPKSRIVAIEHGDQLMKFPVTWLRDNCQCSKCFHPGSTSRILTWEDAKVVKSEPANINVSETLSKHKEYELCKIKILILNRIIDIFLQTSGLFGIRS